MPNDTERTAYQFPMPEENLILLWGDQKVELFLAGAAHIITEARDEGWLDKAAKAHDINLEQGAPLAAVLEAIGKQVIDNPTITEARQRLILDRLATLELLEDTAAVKRLHNSSVIETRLTTDGRFEFTGDEWRPRPLVVPQVELFPGSEYGSSV